MAKQKKEKTKKPLFKRWWFWFIVVIVVIGVAGGFDQQPDPNSTAIPTEVPVESATDVPTEAPTLDMDIFFYESFPNDTTGKWRKALVASTDTIETYALDYYRKYFKADDEIHIIYNFTLKTVNSLRVFGDLLLISVTEYVDGEEHDAKSTGGGLYLGQYHISLESGEVVYSSFDD